MMQNVGNYDYSKMPHLESVSRISHIPLVETGWNYAGNVYDRVKKSNTIVNWGCETAEKSITAIMPVAATVLNSTPVSVIDKVLCKSLDVLDERVPSIYLPPQMMYWNTKQYMLKRADSVKGLGNSVLTSKYTEYAAGTLDGALTVADKYMEKYLPPDSEVDEPKQNDLQHSSENSEKSVVKTINHVDRLSRKLKRQLTKHAIAEAKALKQQSQEAINVLIYVAELVVTDPKLALQKAQELWMELSKDEPENQARPTTLEQSIVLITRETARRIVHMINYASVQVTKLPQSTRHISIQFLHVAETLIKTIHLEETKNKAIVEAKSQIEKVKAILRFLNTVASNLLESIALSLAGGNQNSNSIKSHTKGNKNSAIKDSKNQRQSKTNNHHHHHATNNVCGNGGSNNVEQ